MKCDESQELVTGLIDGELSSSESSLIEAHFRECSECRKAFSREHALKRLVKSTAINIHAPPQLKQNILRDQRRRARADWHKKIGNMFPSVRAIAAQAAVVVVLLGVSLFTARYWLESPQTSIASAVFESYGPISEGKIVPLKMDNVSELKTRLTQLAGGEFAPMGYDFSSMNIHLVGGLLQEVANRKVLVAVYRGPELTIVCYTFVASDNDAPEVANIFFDVEKGIRFHLFHYRHINAVMYREGNINCILMSEMPMPELLNLARAKAHST